MVKTLKTIYASYLYFFMKWSGDPEFATRAFFPLTIVSFVSVVAYISKYLLGYNPYLLVNEHFVFLLFFGTFIPSLFVDLPEPKKNNSVVYTSIFIVSLFVFIPILISIIY